MNYDSLQRMLRRLDGFDADHWGGQLEAAQEQVADSLAQWEATEARRYSPEGQQTERARLRQPEIQARERALTEAEAALSHVADAKAALTVYTGLTEVQQRDADVLLGHYRERAALFTPLELAAYIAADAHLGRRVECWCWMQLGLARLRQLQEDLEAAHDNPVKRSQARAAVETLRPALEAAQKLLDMPTVAVLRAKIAEVEQAAGKLKARALVAPPAAVRAAKLHDGAYGL
jgi:hypothetical protein